MGKATMCPNCQKRMVIVWYHEPNKQIEKYVEEKRVFYRGLELLDNIDDSNKIVYHCFNCNKSYSEDLKICIEESEVTYPYEEVENLKSMIADKVIAGLSNKEIDALKESPEYSHFGFGLYIRNNYIYNNEDIKYKIEPDDFSFDIFEKIIEKITK